MIHNGQYITTMHINSLGFNSQRMLHFLPLRETRRTSIVAVMRPCHYATRLLLQQTNIIGHYATNGTSHNKDKLQTFKSQSWDFDKGLCMS